MFRLITLGGAAVIDDAGLGTGSSAIQRRTLALLSVLATAGDVGISRDKLVALFWPDADTERGRHALTQALYASRRALRCDDLFIVNADVRLNPLRISSDVGDFELALDHDPEHGVGLYRGPFLDGFFLSGSGDFEHWQSAQRARLEERVVRALEHLATSAQAHGESRAAVDWWKRAAGIRPLDSSIAVRLMEALAAAGDRAGALQHAAVHTALLRSQLDLGPDAAITAFAESLREERAPATGNVARPSSTSDTTEPAGSAAAPPNDNAVTELILLSENSAALDSRNALEAVVPISRDSAVWPPTRNRPSVPWRVPLLLVAASVLVLTGIAIGSRAGDSPKLRSSPLRQRVVVAPFRVAGASPSLAYLRDGMVELLSTRLADDSSARSIDAGAVIGAWRASELAPAMDVPRSTVVRLADRLGAERVVVGGVIGTPDRLVVRATVLGVPSGAVVSQAMVEGPADSLTVLIDRLAAKLLLAEAGEDVQLGARVTTSLSALKAFLAGQAAFRANDYATAARRYELALQRDSTFALAALRLALAADRRDEATRVRRGVRIAWGSRSELSERDRAILTGLSGVRFPAPSFAHEQVASWQRAAELMPASAEAWFVFGARAFHDGHVAGLDNPGARASAAFNRALLIDSTYAPAAAMLVRLAARDDGQTVPSPEVKRAALDDSLSPYAPFLRWRLAVLESDSAALTEARAQFTRLGPANLRAIVLASQVDAVGLDDATRALKELHSRSAFRGSVDLLLAEHSMDLNQGRIRDAEALLAEWQSVAPNSGVDLQLRVLAALYGNGDTSVAVSAARRLAQAVAADMQGSSDEVTQPSALCTLAQWQLAAGDTATAAAIAGRLRRSTLTTDTEALGVGARACAELLDAAIAVAGRRRDARARLVRLDSLAFTRETAGDLIAYAPVWLARMHRTMGDTAAALAAVRRRQYATDWPRYLAETLRLQGQLAEAHGSHAEALQSYRRYLALRRAPDAELRAQVDSVRLAAGRLDSLLSRAETRPRRPDATGQLISRPQA